MQVFDIFESASRRLVVTYPGRFQPFHKGHAEVFHELQSKFGADQVYIVTSNKTDGDKSPFNFSDKVRFMNAGGVPAHAIIEAAKVYDLPAQFEADKPNTVFITVVGEPDAKRLGSGGLKKDGTPAYFQPFPGDLNKCSTADKHGYVIVESEKPESIVIGGQKYDVSHGTPTRALWNQIRGDEKARKEFVTQLYGKWYPELAHILDKIPHNTTEVAEALEEGAFKKFEPSTSSTNATPELRGVNIPGNMKHPEWRQPIWSFKEIADKLGISTRELNGLVALYPGFPTKVEGIASKYGSKAYFNQSGVKKWVVGNDIRNAIKSKKQGLSEGSQIERKIHRTQQLIQDYYDRSRATKNDIKRDHYIDMARQLEYELEGMIHDANQAEQDGYDIAQHDAAPSATWNRGGLQEYAKDNGDEPEEGPTGNWKDFFAMVAPEMRKLGFATSKDPAHNRGPEGTVFFKVIKPPVDWRAVMIRQYTEDPTKAYWKIVDGSSGRTEMMDHGLADLNTHGAAFMLVNIENVLQLNESVDGEYNDEAGMAQTNLHTIARAAKGLLATIDDKENLPEWVQEKIAKVQGMLVSAWDYLKSQEEQGIDPQQEVDEHIVKVKGGYELRSKHGNKNLGKYPTKAGAEKRERQVQYFKHAGESIEENAEELHVGDPVIITGDVQFHGKTGDIDSFGRDKRFVIVNLYNHGKHSFHSSDVSYNDYADEEEYMAEDAAAVGVVKNGKDPRYMTATMGDDNDVDASTLGKMMKGYSLVGKNPANTPQKAVNKGVGKGLKESHNMTLDEVNPHNFDSDVDYYAALKGKPKRSADDYEEPIPMPSDEDEFYARQSKAQAQRQATAPKQQQKQIDGTAPNGHRYNTIVRWSGPDADRNRAEARGYADYHWGAKKVVDQVEDENSVTLYVVDNHRYGSWKPFQDVEEATLGTKHKRNRFKSLKQKMDETDLDPTDDKPSPVEGAIIRRIMQQHRDALLQHGPDAVMQAARSVAMRIGDVDEIGSSDVSIWTREALSMLGHELEEDMYSYDKLDPYNSEFAPRAGMGRMTLRGWKQSLIKRVNQLAKELEAAGQDVDRGALWDHVYKKMQSLNMDPIAQEIEQAQAELEHIRQKGGQRSRAFGKRIEALESRIAELRTPALNELKGLLIYTDKYDNGLTEMSAGGTGAGGVATSMGNGNGFGVSIFYKQKARKAKKK